MVPSALSEEDFLGFSSAGWRRKTHAILLRFTLKSSKVRWACPRNLAEGFRPGRAPHGALDVLAVAIDTRKVNPIPDADAENVSGTIERTGMVRFPRHRVGGRRVIRLIRQGAGLGPFCCEGLG